jgi:hypothetical protein
VLVDLIKTYVLSLSDFSTEKQLSPSASVFKTHFYFIYLEKSIKVDEK